MNTRAVTRLMLSSLAVYSPQLGAENPGAINVDRIPLTIHIYNLAYIDRPSLGRSLDEAGRILAMAGVQAVWELGGVDTPEAHMMDMTVVNLAQARELDERGFLVLRIVRGFPKTGLPGTLGFALPSACHGAHVTIFYDRIENVAEKVPPGPAKILSNALAHEIGHVLLYSEQHSPSGVMKGVWDRADYQHLASRPLEFLSDEAVILRGSALRRAAIGRLKRSDPVKARCQVAFHREE